MSYIGPTIADIRLNPRAWRLRFDILRFHYCAEADDDVSLGDYLARERYSPQLFNDYLLVRGPAVRPAKLS